MYLLDKLAACGSAVARGAGKLCNAAFSLSGAVWRWHADNSKKAFFAYSYILSYTIGTATFMSPETNEPALINQYVFNIFQVGALCTAEVLGAALICNLLEHFEFQRQHPYMNLLICGRSPSHMANQISGGSLGCLIGTTGLVLLGAIGGPNITLTLSVIMLTNIACLCAGTGMIVGFNVLNGCLAEQPEGDSFEDVPIITVHQLPVYTYGTLDNVPANTKRNDNDDVSSASAVPSTFSI